MRLLIILIRKLSANIGCIGGGQGGNDVPEHSIANLLALFTLSQRIRVFDGVLEAFAYARVVFLGRESECEIMKSTRVSDAVKLPVT